MTEYTLTRNKFLSDEEFEHLTQTLHRFSDREPRNTLIFFLLLYTGARPSELLNVRPMDVDWVNGSIFLFGIKGSRDRDIPLPPWLMAKLRAYNTLPLQSEEKLFPIAYNTLGQIWREYRPCKKTLRATRHTFALRIYKKTKDARLVQRALGHKWLSTTEIYLDFDYGAEEFRRLIL